MVHKPGKQNSEDEIGTGRLANGFPPLAPKAWSCPFKIREFLIGGEICPVPAVSRGSHVLLYEFVNFGCLPPQIRPTSPKQDVSGLLRAAAVIRSFNSFCLK